MTPASLITYLAIAIAVVSLPTCCEASDEASDFYLDMLTKMKTATDVDIEKQTTDFMHEAMSVEEAMPAIAKVGGAKTLVGMLGSEYASVKKKECACRGLGVLAFDDANRAALVEAGGLEAMVEFAASGLDKNQHSKATLDLFGIQHATNGVLSLRSPGGKEMRLKALLEDLGIEFPASSSGDDLKKIAVEQKALKQWETKQLEVRQSMRQPEDL